MFFNGLYGGPYSLDEQKPPVISQRRLGVASNIHQQCLCDFSFLFSYLDFEKFSCFDFSLYYGDSLLFVCLLLFLCVSDFMTNCFLFQPLIFSTTVLLKMIIFLLFISLLVPFLLVIRGNYNKCSNKTLQNQFILFS